jgi:integrase
VCEWTRSLGLLPRTVLKDAIPLSRSTFTHGLAPRPQCGLPLDAAKDVDELLREGTDPTTAAFLTHWIAGMGSHLRGSTHLRYEQLVRIHLVPRIGRIPLAKLAPSDLSAMYAAMTADGLAPRTAGHAHRVLGRALHDAEIDGQVTRNVCRLVRPPRVPHAEMKTLSGDQARALVDAPRSDRLGALWHVALASGARLGELLGLTWDAVDVERGTIRITRTLTRTRDGLTFGEPKTSNSRRTVPIGAAATAALRRHRAAQEMERRVAGSAWHTGDLVFTDEIGRPIDGTHVAHTFRGVLARVGLPRVRFHDLRHTAATLLLEAGLHPRVVAERLGHATPALVMNTYGHVTERMQTEATAILNEVLGG